MSLLLLDSLKDGLDDQYVHLLDQNPEFYKDAEDYLLELLINDDLLSTDPFTTSTTPSTIEDSASSKRH